MVAEMAVEAAGDTAVVVDAPLVTGAVAAAVAAQGGADLADVAAAALRGEAADEPAAGSAERDAAILLTNDIGLHARPAALLARAVSELDAKVTISFGDKQVDARSVLGLMALGARGGDTIRVSAGGAQAGEALARIRDLAERNFDE
jgi:PTS hybrid protein